MMKRVCIIGGGFSGMITAFHLLSKSDKVNVTVVNYKRPLFTGIAYSTSREEHLLNVPAGRMSAFQNDPDHFVQWLGSQAEYKDGSGPLEDSFIPRMIYGRYLKELLAEFIYSERLSIINDQATDITKTEEGYLIHFQGNSIIVTDVVLATGNYLPAPPRIADTKALSDPQYFPDPWSAEFLVPALRSKNILLIGTGLTMIDCVLNLHKENYQGEITVVSPRGYIPETHSEFSSEYPDFYDELADQDLKDLLKTVRKHLDIASAENIPWQSVIDKIRPYTQRIWLKLDLTQKQQFISHLRHIWGVARHRLPGKIHLIVRTLIAEERMKVIGGRITEIKKENNEFLISVSPRKTTGLKTIKASVVINCTGPQTNLAEMDEPLIKNLISGKLIIPDEHKLGLKALPDGKVLDDSGKPHKGLYAVGSLLKGVLWESTAVPELRVSAENVAGQIIGNID
jgi:uncharacterized NAD(P)/FAD-binding protein YdhS